jgi:hypothetical protein
MGVLEFDSDSSGHFMQPQCQYDQHSRICTSPTEKRGMRLTSRLRRAFAQAADKKGREAPALK